MHYKGSQDRHQVMMLSYDSMISQDNPVRLLDMMCRRFVESNPDQFLKKVRRKRVGKLILLLPYLTCWCMDISTASPRAENLRRNLTGILKSSGLWKGSSQTIGQSVTLERKMEKL